MLLDRDTYHQAVISTRVPTVSAADTPRGATVRRKDTANLSIKFRPLT